MPVSCSDFIGYADAISLDAPEIELRSLVSRAYYGAYHACREWHESKPPQPGHNLGLGGGAHQQLINQLTNPDASCSGELKLKSRSLGYALSAIKVARTLADYGLTEALSKEDAANTRTQAKALVLKALQ